MSPFTKRDTLRAFSEGFRAWVFLLFFRSFLYFFAFCRPCLFEGEKFQLRPEIAAGRRAMDDGVLDPTQSVVRVAVSLVTLLCILLATNKESRTRQESRFHHFYARMRDDEFRRTFRETLAVHV